MYLACLSTFRVADDPGTIWKQCQYPKKHLGFDKQTNLRERGLLAGWRLGFFETRLGREGFQTSAELIPNSAKGAVGPHLFPWKQKRVLEASSLRFTAPVSPTGDEALFAATIRYIFRRNCDHKQCSRRCMHGQVRCSAQPKRA
jgi:hypothetical protein